MERRSCIARQAQVLARERKATAHEHGNGDCGGSTENGCARDTHHPADCAAVVIVVVRHARLFCGRRQERAALRCRNSIARMPGMRMPERQQNLSGQREHRQHNKLRTAPQEAHPMSPSHAPGYYHKAQWCGSKKADLLTRVQTTDAAPGVRQCLQYAHRRFYRSFSPLGVKDRHEHRSVDARSTSVIDRSRDDPIRATG